MDRAVELLESALERVGQNAVLHTALGFAYTNYVNSGVRPELFEQYLAKAAECQAKVAALAPDSVESIHLHALLAGFLDVRDMRFDHAIPNRLRLHRAVGLECHLNQTTLDFSHFDPPSYPVSRPRDPFLFNVLPAFL